jgi:hypothetical protein
MIKSTLIASTVAAIIGGSAALPAVQCAVVDTVQAIDVTRLWRPARLPDTDPRCSVTVSLSNLMPGLVGLAFNPNLSKAQRDAMASDMAKQALAPTVQALRFAARNCSAAHVTWMGQTLHVPGDKLHGLEDMASKLESGLPRRAS